MTKAPDNANYADWARHFGKSTRAPELVAEFEAAGLTKGIRLRGSDMHESEDVGALTVNVMHPILFGHEERAFPRGVAIFAGIAIHLKDYGDNGYAGELPFEIRRDDNQATLRERFGAPDITSDKRAWDQWTIDELIVTAHYSPSFSDLMTVTVFLPEVE